MCEAMSADDNEKQKALLDRRAAELAKLGQRGYALRAELGKTGSVRSIPIPIPISWLTAPKPIIVSLFLHLH